MLYGIFRAFCTILIFERNRLDRIRPIGPGRTDRADRSDASWKTCCSRIFLPSLPSHTLHTMPRVSKSKQAKQNNIAKASEVLASKRSQANTSITHDSPHMPSELGLNADSSLDDTYSSWDPLLGDELPDAECTQPQETGEDEEDMELMTETALDIFTQFLVDAQKAAEKAEHQLELETGRRKRRKTYTGHSRQTIKRRKETEKKMRAEGFSVDGTNFSCN